MSSEALGRRVAPPTLGTAEGLLSRVAELVLLQVAHLEETLPAAGAPVAPLSGLWRHCRGLGAMVLRCHGNGLIWIHFGGPGGTPSPSSSLRPRGRGGASRGRVQPRGLVMKAARFGCQAGAAAGGRSCGRCVCCGRSVSQCQRRLLLILLLLLHLLLFPLLFCASSSSSWSSRLECCHLLLPVFLDN